MQLAAWRTETWLDINNRQLTELVKAKAQSVHDVNIAKFGGFENGHGMIELLAEVGRAHVVEPETELSAHTCPLCGKANAREQSLHAIGSDADANTIGRHNRRYGCNDLLQKTGAILDASTVRVATLVRLGLQKLVDEITVGSVNLHAIESRSHAESSSSLVVRNNAGDFALFKCARSLVWHCARSCVRCSVDGDGRGRYGKVAVKEAAVRRAAHVPQLEENFATLGVNSIGDFLPSSLQKHSG